MGGLYICLLSIHGLIRGHDLELGRDADTGGQTRYVVELACALAACAEVARVDLLTRLIDDPQVSADYAAPSEDLGGGARIVRIAAGSPGYIAKEQLWEHLDGFVDDAIALLRAESRLPDLLHSHYADAGYAGSRICHILGIPLVHTGHSLGRVKRGRLLASGLDAGAIEERYNLSRRIEAAASGLPIVATEDGGPRDIIGNCHNGVLVNPLDPAAIAAAIKELLADRERWQQRSLSGLESVRKHYSMSAHAQAYLETVRPIIERTEPPLLSRPTARRPLLYHDRAIFTDLDESLLHDPASVPELMRLIRQHHNSITFGIVTGRRLDSALSVMKQHGIPEPHVLITGCGTAIHYAPELTEDLAWTRHIERQWTPQVIRRVLGKLPGLVRQAPQAQGPFKISYYIDPDKAPSLPEINHLLYQEEQAANVLLSFGQFLDVVPMRASKGLALRYVAARWDIALDRVLVAGGSGADEDMMRGNTLAVVVGNRHDEELSMLTDTERIYFARSPGARGILEGIEHYRFLDGAAAVQAAGP